LLRRSVPDPPFFENDKPFIENGYESFASTAPTDWILRLDCDEVPSPALIEAACRFVDSGSDAVMGFERHQLLWRNGKFRTAETDRFQPKRQMQYRLFNRQSVSFVRDIHTPGIRVDRSVFAPSDAPLYHMSWIFLSLEDRKRKASRYDAHGQPSSNRENQLFPIEQVEWKDLSAPFLEDCYKQWLDQSRALPWAARLKTRLRDLVPAFLKS
jgi:hypothetical protein